MTDLRNSPAYKDAYYQKMEPAFRKMTAFREGVSKMLDEGYLVKAERETDHSYNLRKKMAALFNATAKTVNSAVGMIFRQPVTTANLSKKFNIEDVDNYDSSLNEFARNVCESSIWYGISYIMVDAPTFDEDGNPVNGDDSMPYFVMVEPFDVISRRYSRINGQTVLSQVVIREKVIEYEGDFGEKEVTQYRVLRIGGGFVMREESKDKYAIVEGSQWHNDLDYIPFVPVYSRRTGYMEGKPTYEDLADLNIIHFNTHSQMYKSLYIAGVPVPVFRGKPASAVQNQNGEVIISADNAIVFTDPESDFHYEEFSGSSISKMQEELDKIETRMAIMGLSILTKRDGGSGTTATEAAIIATKENSDLMSIANSLEWSLKKAYEYWCDMAGIKPEKDVTIEVNKNFVKEMLDVGQANLIIGLYEKGLISIDELWTHLEKGGILNLTDREKMADELDIQPPTFVNNDGKNPAKQPAPKEGVEE